MVKANVFDISKWFLEHNLDTPRNTFKGNMKLQKLLFFSQLISLAQNGETLFDERFSAFENGMVVEPVRKMYKDNLNNILNYKSQKLNEKQVEILELTKKIYGMEDADTLSEMSHEFTYWNKYYNYSRDENNYKDKNKAEIPNEELSKELDNIRDVLYAFKVIEGKDYKRKLEEIDY